MFSIHIREGKSFDVKQFPSIVDVAYNDVSKTVRFRVQYMNPAVTFAEFRFSKDLTTLLPVDKQHLASKAVNKFVYESMAFQPIDMKIVNKRVDGPSVDGWPWLSNYQPDKPFTAKVQVHYSVKSYLVVANLWLQRYDTEERLFDYANLTVMRILEDLHYHLSFIHGGFYFER